MCYVFIFVQNECLQLDRLSTWQGRQLQMDPSKYELNFLINDNGQCRYAVSSHALPTDCISEWAVDVIELGFVCVGIIADNSIDMNDGRHNINHSSFCGWCCCSDGYAVIFTNGSYARNDDMRVAAGDVMLYRYDPSARQLKMMNARTGKSVIISNVNAKQPDSCMYITASLCKFQSSSSSHIRFRMMTSEEQEQMK